MLKKLFLPIILTFISQIIIAQDIVVVGQVLSAENSEPLQAASVWFKGTNIGCTTNEEGFFMLRSNEPQRTLIASVVGYKQRQIKLDYGKDQMIRIYLKEDISILDEVIAMPKQDEAIILLKKVYENRRINNPENVTNISTTMNDVTAINLTNIRQKALQRKLFKDLMSGAIEQTDTTFSLPVYINQSVYNLQLTPDSNSSTLLNSKQNALNIFPPEHWQQIIAAYTPDINPYKPYSTILGHNFMSPVAPNAKLYYNLYLADSTLINGRKNYQIKFSPKYNQGLLFKGDMWIDSITYAITKTDISIPTHTSVNFLNSLNYGFTTEPFGNSIFPNKEKQGIGLNVNLYPNKDMQYFGAVLSEERSYENTTSTTDTLSIRPEEKEIEIPTDDKLEATWNKIDSLNQTRIQKLSAWAVDIILNQYLHAWKIDIGPVLNLFHFNQLEGAAPRLTLRSGESFAKYFTFGGYYGYGFKDQYPHDSTRNTGLHSYGGNIQWRFGPTKRNILSFTYDHKTERIGYDDTDIYAESRVHDIENLVNSWVMIHRPVSVLMRGRIGTQYQYEQPGFKFRINAFAQNYYGNRFIPLIHKGAEVPYYSQIGLRTDFRLSWQQSSLDYFFHRIYLASKYPVVHLTAEGGYIKIPGSQQNEPYHAMFSKFGIYAQQHTALGFGKIHWAFQANAVVGNAPFPALIMARSSRTSYRHDTDFMLLGSMELMSDFYTALNIRYQTRGYIFGYIPYVKKLGIREDIIFNIGYGYLSPKYQKDNILALPANLYNVNQGWDKMPYIELGFGFSNILKIGDIAFVWRLTHRNSTSPDAQNFGVKWRVGLDF
ncbi:MAG: carboxypeptidase-like regulatory domain-containing protein [Paludibacteraceae bacterium]|nr:carboxypeptidase-like regulatory domain-containing protein [Paludibacteraceae bacterium]